MKIFFLKKNCFSHKANRFKRFCCFRIHRLELMCARYDRAAAERAVHRTGKEDIRLTSLTVLNCTHIPNQSSKSFLKK